MSRAVPAPSSSTDTLLLAYRAVVTLFAVLVVVQGYLGSRGVFAAESGLITGHELIANTMFLLVVVQTALSWVIASRGLFGLRAVGLNVVLIVLTIAQIGLGYSTRGENFVDVVSLHIPNGVLMMGIATVVATAAWQAHPARRATGMEA